MEEGTYNVSHTVALPREIPKGKRITVRYKPDIHFLLLAAFNINVHGYTVADEDMVCLNLKIDFRQHSFFGF